MYEVVSGGEPLTFGNLENAVPAGHVSQNSPHWVAGQFNSSVSWRVLESPHSRWDGPIVVKGSLVPDDVRGAVVNGVDAIIVSNHGGVDSTPPPRRSVFWLPSPTWLAVRSRFLVDGGLRSGKNVIKARSLRARASLITRLWLYAVAARDKERH